MNRYTLPVEGRIPVTVEATTFVTVEATTMRSVTIKLSQFAVDSLVGEERRGAVRMPARMEGAVRCYLGDRDSGRPAWAYPDFLRGAEVQEDVTLELRLDEDLWRSFEEEAARQGVTPQQMAEHAAFYLAAEVNAGRVTQRILDSLEFDTSRAD